MKLKALFINSVFFSIIKLIHMLKITEASLALGSTGVATFKNNRSFIGIELESKYYQIAKQRINKEDKDE